jgi:transposase
VLSEFRTRLVARAAEERLLEAVLALCKEQGWLKGQGQQRTDSTHVLARIRPLSPAECVVETLGHALDILSVVTPDWLHNHVQPDWLERYGPRASEYRFPSAQDQRHQFLQQVGQDGWGLLSAITSDRQSQWMLAIPAVDTLQRIWKQDYLPPEQGGTWMAEQDRLEAARVFFSPYDLDASAAKKRSTYWIG